MVFQVRAEYTTNILRRILQLYPYKLQSCHELLPADTAQREAFAKPSLKWNRIPPGFLTSCGQMKLISRFMTLLLETQCPVNGWITETVNAQCYLTLLVETVVPCLIQRGQISNVTFMQDGATSHTAHPVKAFLIQKFEKTESLADAAGTHRSSVSRFNTGRDLVVGIFEI
ncbi:hypothetical protein TNCV_3438371 [Trichonephila clavipes]|nr:hypothetical protein TNCV_3438371 [Trichonephila clavipes]